MPHAEAQPQTTPAASPTPAAALLRDFANPALTLEEIADRHNIPLDDLVEQLNAEPFLRKAENYENAARNRARIFITNAAAQLSQPQPTTANPTDSPSPSSSSPVPSTQSPVPSSSPSSPVPSAQSPMPSSPPMPSPRSPVPSSASAAARLLNASHRALTADRPTLTNNPRTHEPSPRADKPRPQPTIHEPTQPSNPRQAERRARANALRAELFRSRPNHHDLEDAGDYDDFNCAQDFHDDNNNDPISLPPPTTAKPTTPDILDQLPSNLNPLWRTAQRASRTTPPAHLASLSGTATNAPP